MPLRLHSTFSERLSTKTSRFSTTVEKWMWRIVDECVKNNTILYMSAVCDDNGLDKAAVVLRFCRLCIDGALVGAKKACIFAPTVPILKEYYAAAMRTPGLLVAQLIFGTAAVDVWERKDWREAVEQNDLLICTPGVFLDALRSEQIAMGDFCAIALDECQHCIGSHPMAKIVSEYAVPSNLRVLGLGRQLWRTKFRHRAEQKEAVERLQEALHASVRHASELM